ncbi:hypothetical protein A3A63_04175 [Candidatus Gottesmanbacteria bacterium RIFCSPLOWO2_01_FULL_46_9]|uniref:Uncharacterized protein n=1 Tax=Candidatus Gottesmanbacteria bacterium RIFCSPLOWO2_01_FULL_46_9 TaxID=1798394 RepID=A0A1F6B325_9BACT|nr:MAG: hypothetical protein A3A63_04175 [Candidatus Gottesmanbacteria bacterium RIFCSPLOWO2_01_FULL_46_9]
MTKKSFVVILILSVIIWIVSGIIQFMISFNPYSSCALTGFPMASCLNSASKLRIICIYIFNIVFWFLVIWCIWKVLKKKKLLHKKKK